MNVQSIIYSSVEWLRSEYGSFLVWWIVGCSVILLLSEIVHRLLSDNKIASKAFVWRTAVVVALFLPISYSDLLSSPVVCGSRGILLGYWREGQSCRV